MPIIYYNVGNKISSALKALLFFMLLGGANIGLKGVQRGSSLKGIEYINLMDVIMVGELRDAETIGIALTAAETGHLVLATLHTQDAVGTVNRILDVLPDRQHVCTQLADCLLGICCQRLLPRCDRAGRAAAFEVLVATPALRNLIREGRTHQLQSYLQTGARYGMQTMEDAVKALQLRGIIA